MTLANFAYFLELTYSLKTVQSRFLLQKDSNVDAEAGTTSTQLMR